MKLRFSDPSIADGRLDATLDELQEIASQRDLEGLEKFTGPAFFWEQDFDELVDDRASAVPKLAVALGLNDEDTKSAGWERLLALATSRTRTRHPFRKGVVCVPGEASYEDPGEARRAFRETGTRADENWGWVEDVEVKAASETDAAALTLLSDEAVRVLDWEMDSSPGWAMVETADGATGFVPLADLRSWSPERLCFRREANGSWGVAGYRSGE